MRGSRIGVVNPRTPFGARVRELLSQQRIPVTELKLFESEVAGEATLTQFGDDVVVTQPIDLDLFPHLDVLFVSGLDSDVMNRIAREAASKGTLTIVEGAFGLEAPVAAPGVPDEDVRSERIALVPRMASYLLGVTLGRVRRSLSVAHASATVLLPAGERGDAGADELHQQIVHILNMRPPPTEVFQSQIAFNTEPAGGGRATASLAEAVELEAGAIAGLEGAVTASLVRVPVFHGYSASIWVELAEPAEQRSITTCFRDPPFTMGEGKNPAPPTPVSAAESPHVHVGGIRRPGELARSGFWVWVVADTTAYDPALAAVDLAKRVLGEG